MQLQVNDMGSHEFDGGLNDFARLVNAANYPFIAVNLDFSAVILEEGTPQPSKWVQMPKTAPCMRVWHVR